MLPTELNVYDVNIGLQTTSLNVFPKFKASKVKLPMMLWTEKTDTCGCASDTEFVPMGERDTTTKGLSNISLG